MDSRITLSSFTGLDPQDWTIQTSGSPHTIIHNLTRDEFMHQIIPYKSKCIVDTYKARAQYKIPHTPQVIIADCQAVRGSLELFIERGSCNVNKLLRGSQCQESTLAIFKKVLSVIEVLIKKYGFFRLTSKMVRASNCGNLLVWLHESFQCNHRQLPFSTKSVSDDVRTVVLDIMSIFEEIRHLKAFQVLKDKINHEKVVSFSKIINFLEIHLMKKACSGSPFKNGEELKEGKGYPIFQIKNPQKSMKTVKSQRAINQESLESGKNFNKFHHKQKKINYQHNKSLSGEGIKSQQISLISTVRQKENNSMLKQGCSSMRNLEQGCTHNRDGCHIQNIQNRFCYHSQSSINLDEHGGSQNDSNIRSKMNQKSKGSILPKVAQKIGLKTDKYWQGLQKVLSDPSLCSQQQSFKRFNQIYDIQIKNNFRDSGNSLATTNFFNSITSSGKTKLLDDELPHAFTQAKAPLLASFGFNEKQTGKLEDRFAVKASKIIEEHSQDWACNNAHSICRSEREAESMVFQSDFERDFGSILMSQKPTTRQSSQLQKEMQTLESEMRNILDWG